MRSQTISRIWHVLISYSTGRIGRENLLAVLIALISFTFDSQRSRPHRLMEPEGLLLCLQEPAIGPYPERDESNPHPPIFPLYD
jgi:hypothetical protein